MIGSRRGKGLLVIPDNWERGRGRREREKMEVLNPHLYLTVLRYL